MKSQDRRNTHAVSANEVTHDQIEPPNGLIMPRVQAVFTVEL